MRTLTALKPDAASFGYAAFLSVNATSVWGGVYPYLEPAMQTPRITILFYTLQLAAFTLSFLLILAAVWRRPKLTSRSFTFACAVQLAAGPLMLIGAMYLEALALPLIVFAALLLGCGSAGMLAGWQRVFSSLEAWEANLALIKGTGFSAPVYFCICLVPAALAAYLVPLVLVPVAALCLYLAEKRGDTHQPMFEDVPREHVAVYRNALGENLLPALGIGSLGFCSGTIRFIGVTHQALLSAINVLEMLALLVVMGAFFCLWRRRTIRLSLSAAMDVLVPVAATCLLILPFAGARFTAPCSAVAYAAFSLACLLMMMHCGQVSRDSGINPLFMFSFYAAIVYAFQLAGHVVGYASGSASTLGLEQLSFVGLLCLYLLLVVALLGRKARELHTGRLEFLTLGQDKLPSASPEHITAEVELASAAAAQARVEVGPTAMGEAGAEPEAGNPVSRRCSAAARLYNLTARELEVLELVARGFSGPAIAKQLFISENTMRTHTKRIYAKLGVHKKQELLQLLEKL
ncbi:MAG: response regulator transcription factor [Coriobacteriales bacterium]